MQNFNIKDMQKIELEILLEVDRICKKNNIKYFLISGTLLGAIRHKGFIPWDDDIDICMPIDDYYRFCKIARTDLNKNYFLQNYKTDLSDRWFAKVRKNNTTCIERGYKNKKIHQGIWIDIFPLIGVKNDEKWLRATTQKATFAKKLLSKRFSSIISPADLSAEKKILKCVPLCLIRFIVNLIYKTIFKSTNNYDFCYYLWGDSKIRARFNSDLFEELCEVEFEGHLLPAPKKWDEYLTLVYNDYMTPPPPEKRNGGSHTLEIVDTNNDYSKYVN